MDTPKNTRPRYQEQLEEARKELRRVEMEQARAKAGMAGTETRTFVEDSGECYSDAPLRLASLETAVGTLCEVVARLEISLQVPDRAHDSAIDETEKRLLSDAASVLEAKLIRMALTIERCNFNITECVGAIDRIQAKIGS